MSKRKAPEGTGTGTSERIMKTPIKPRVVAQNPKLCVGTIGKLVEPKLSEKGVYYVQRITLEGVHGSPDARTNILFLPEWLSTSFDANEAYTGTMQAIGDANDPQYREARSRNFVYQNNIAVPERSTKIPTLMGLAGSYENYVELMDAIMTEEEAQTPEAFFDGLRSFVREHEGTIVGYILRQKKEKLDDGTEVLTEQWEVNGFFFPADTDKQEYLVNKLGYQVTFDDELPF